MRAGIADRARRPVRRRTRAGRWAAIAAGSRRVADAATGLAGLCRRRSWPVGSRPRGAARDVIKLQIRPVTQPVSTPTRPPRRTCCCDADRPVPDLLRDVLGSTSHRRLAIDGKAARIRAYAIDGNPLDPEMSGEARLIDVATAAGVSLRTASRVSTAITGSRARPASGSAQAISTLDFQPDMMARSLRAGTDTAIGFIVESIADPFFAEVIDTVEADMARHGRSVLVASTHRDREQEQAVIRRMGQRRVAGLLVVPTGPGRSWLRTATTPVVLVDRGVPGAVADLIDIDDRQAAYDAVTHLIEHGHRRIAYIGDTSSIATSAARLRGYHDALHARWYRRRRRSRRILRRDEPGGRRRCERTDRPASPTAIFSATTRASLGHRPGPARARTNRRRVRRASATSRWPTHSYPASRSSIIPERASAQPRRSACWRGWTTPNCPPNTSG